MKVFLKRGPFAILYVFAGGTFLWASAARDVSFYTIAGVCFLALAVWEGRAILRDLRAGRAEEAGWTSTFNLACVILALCQVCRGAIEPTDFNIAIAVGWSVIGAVWAVRFVRESRAAREKRRNCHE